MPLILAPQNVDLQIVKVAADDKTKKRLESLGITVWGTITVLNSCGGNVVCKIKDGRVAIDRQISSKIFVRQ